MKVLPLIGARTYAKEDRQKDDFYATEPRAIDDLLKYESFNKNIWECAAGQGHLAQRLKEYGYTVKCSDLIDRGYEGTEIKDFLHNDEKFNGDIITNPPYKHTIDFILNSLNAIPEGNKVAMFLKVQNLEGVNRYKKIFKNYRPKNIYVYSGRIKCAKNGEFEKMRGNAIAYAWFVWVKGDHKSTTVDWIY